MIHLVCKENLLKKTKFWVRTEWIFILVLYVMLIFIYAIPWTKMKMYNRGTFMFFSLHRRRLSTA